MDSMTYLPLLANFFAGAFLCNCIPHLASGLQGKRFPTPFSRPRGVGESSARTNFVWGFFNFWQGVFLLVRHPVEIKLDLSFFSLALGALLLGLYLSSHFSKTRS